MHERFIDQCNLASLHLTSWSGALCLWIELLKERFREMTCSRARELLGLPENSGWHIESIAESKELKISRACLVEAVGLVVQHGLKLLGMETVERM